MATAFLILLNNFIPHVMADFGAKEPTPTHRRISTFRSRSVLAAKLVVTELSDRKLKAFSPKAQQVSCEPCAVLTASVWECCAGVGIAHRLELTLCLKR